MEAETVKTNWKERGFSFGIWEDLPGQVWEDYIQSVDKLFMLAQGDVTLVIDSKTIAAVIGEEIFILAESKHTVSTSKKGSSRWYCGYRKHS
jgi:hypothetical protein